MKNFSMLIVLSSLLLCSCPAYADGVKLGMLQNSAMTEEGFLTRAKTQPTIWTWKVLDTKHGNGTSYHFYEDLISMLMALNSGKIDELELPKACAEYVINTNPDYKICCVSCSRGATFSFGFLEDKGGELQKKFNYALSLMRKDGTIDALQLKYLRSPGKIEIDPVKFDSFPEAETIKIALTGYLPPIDFVGTDGKPKGFNVAMIAEIARRLKINVEILNVTTGSRTQALTSGRANVIFCYRLIDGAEVQYDAPEGVIFSQPFYYFDIFAHVKKK